MTLICRVCQQPDARHWLDTDDGPWFRCLWCGSDSSPTEYAAIKGRYDAEYVGHIVRSVGSLQAAIDEQYTNLEWFGRFAERPGRFLDVGCLEGAGMIGMAQRGWDAWGFEVIPEAASDRVRIGDRFRRELYPCRFDAIQCREVIEHVPAWQTLLKECWLALEPRGLLQVQTPRPYHEYHAIPYHWAHLQIFSPAALLSAMRAIGFKVLASEYWPIGQKLLARKL